MDTLTISQQDFGKLSENLAIFFNVDKNQVKKILIDFITDKTPKTKSHPLKIIRSDGFYDHLRALPGGHGPWSGLAEYTPVTGPVSLVPEIVYFTIENDGTEEIDVKKLDLEHQKQIEEIKDFYKEAFYKYMPYDLCEDNIGMYKGYIVNRYDNFSVQPVRSFKIYRLPENIMQEYKTKSNSRLVEGFDVKNFECLGSFYWYEFENWNIHSF